MCQDTATSDDASRPNCRWSRVGRKTESDQCAVSSHCAIRAFYPQLSLWRPSATILLTKPHRSSGHLTSAAKACATAPAASPRWLRSAASHFYEQLGRRTSPRLILEIDIRQRSPAVLARLALLLSCILFRWRIHKFIETVKTLVHLPLRSGNLPLSLQEQKPVWVLALPSRHSSPGVPCFDLQSQGRCL
jgi:hypothetical protein